MGRGGVQGGGEEVVQVSTEEEWKYQTRGHTHTDGTHEMQEVVANMGQVSLHSGTLVRSISGTKNGGECEEVIDE